MAEPEAAASLPKKKALPWLKRLKGALDDDDSSDSSSQPREPSPKKAARKKEAQSGKRRLKTKRQQAGSSSDSDEAEQNPRRRLKMATKAQGVRRKRSVETTKAAKEESSESKRATTAARREQRKHKLQAARVDAGEHKIMAKRQQSAAAFKEKERQRIRAIRAKKGDRKTPTGGTEAGIEDEGAPPRQLRRPNDSATVTADKSGLKRKRSRNAPMKSADDAKQEATGSTPLDIVDKAPEAVKPGDDKETHVETLVVVNGIPPPSKSDDGKAEGSVTSPEPVTPDGNEATVTKDTSSEPEKPQVSGEGQVSATESATDTYTEPDKPQDTDAIKPVPGMTHSETSVETAIPDSTEKASIEPQLIVEGIVPPAGKGSNEEEQVGPSKNASTATSLVNDEGVDGQASEDKKKEMLLDTMPIPRKVTKEKEPTEVPSAESFVIPKRTFAKTGIDGSKTITQLGQTDTEGTRENADKRSLDPPVPVAMPPLPSPQSSPKLPPADPVRPQRKRTKNPVPVKSLLHSPQNRALMRLSRKRNSIFMAAAELAAQGPDIRSNKRGSATQMAGYEVYDGGKELPDLIPRLSCATKREMALKQESYGASFFGVSLAAPKAKENASSNLDECGDDEVGTRILNCYEELRFERPEDRELYQRKMYGTAFVPLNLRGGITLIVRNARFERKSTGIRFNQDRDREEFAASLSKRYTFNKSVPRCDIPRENWQKLLRNQPGTVYMHYYNREDAERASHIFRDDIGHPLELKLDYKAGVKLRRSFSPALRQRPQRIPRRSCSSERSVPEPSPLSSQNGSARNTPLRRRDHQPISKNDHRYARYDRGAPPPSGPWPRGESRYGPPASGNKRSRALLERNSRSRSRPKSFHTQQYEPDAPENRAESGRSNVESAAPAISARTGGSSASSVVHSDEGTPARKRARTLPCSPRQSSIGDQERSMREEKFGNVQGEVRSSSEVALMETFNGGGERNEGQGGRSHPRRWQEPNNPRPHHRRDSFSRYSRDQSREPATERQQQRSRESSKRRGRSRSRPRTSSPSSHGDRNRERRSSREFGGGGGYGNNTRDQRMHANRGRGGFNRGRGSSNSGPR